MEEKGQSLEERFESMRRQLRLQAAEAFLEGRLHAGFVLSLAAAFLGPTSLERVLAKAKQGLDEAVALAGLYLMGQRPKKRHQTWPSGRGWGFLQDAIKEAVALDHGELVLYLTRASSVTPLFLASVLAVALEEWGGTDPRSLALAREMVEKAAPLAVRHPGFQTWLGGDQGNTGGPRKG